MATDYDTDRAHADAIRFAHCTLSAEHEPHRDSVALELAATQLTDEAAGRYARAYRWTRRAMQIERDDLWADRFSPTA